MNREIRIIIAGGRDFNRYDFLSTVVTSVISKMIGPFNRSIDESNIKIISGRARGADQHGERFAEENGYECVKFPAKWDELGKRAGYVRNVEMAKYAKSDDAYGVLIAFWDRKSKGTEHMIDIAKKYGLETHIFTY